MKFRIWTILWVFALFASGMATFGGVGIFTSLAVIGIWTKHFFKQRLRPVEWIVAILILVILVAWLTPTVQVARKTARRAMCISNMKQILLAMHNYCDRKGTFPPPFLIDANGKELLSWRCLVLPDIESLPLYSRLQHDEPWDSVSNTKLLNQAGQLEVYRCPSHSQNSQGTHYFAVVDERAA